MKKSNADVMRAKVLAVIINLFDEMGEDLGVISSGALNFPVVADDGEEGWVEVHVKIPKGTKDEDYDGYGRRKDYQILVAERAEKAKARAEAKAKKMARDKARREKEDTKSSSLSSAPWPEDSMHTAMMKHAKGGW